MSDTFEQLIEADIGSMLRGVGSSVASKVTGKGKEYGNRFLARLSSARAEGRLDLDYMVTDLRNTWMRYKAQQRLQSTPAAVVDFLQTVFGMEMDEAAVHRTIFGTNPNTAKAPKMIAPNSAVLADKFKKLSRAKGNEAQLSQIANDLVRYAEANEGDAQYITRMLTFIGSKSPELLKQPSLVVLAPWAHGGLLTDAQMKTLLTAIGKEMLKRQIIIQRMEDERAAGGSPTAGTGAADDDDAAPAATNTAPTPASTSGKISLNPESTQQEPNWGGLIRPQNQGNVLTPQQVFAKIKTLNVLRVAAMDEIYRQAENDQFWIKYREIAESGNFRIVNALSAQLMQLVTLYPQQDFLAVIMEQQRDIGLYWPQKNAAKAWEFVKRGGSIDEVTAELNHFCGTPDKAAVIFVILLRLISKEWMRRHGGDAAAAPAAPAPAADTPGTE